MNRDYEQSAAHMHPSVINHWTGTGLAMSIAANRVSYIFNLTGPSLSIDCACSSSLVALHLACQAIKQGLWWSYEQCVDAEMHCVWVQGLYGPCLPNRDKLFLLTKCRYCKSIWMKASA